MDKKALFVENLKHIKDSVEKEKEMLRLGIIAELDAVNLYEQMAELADDENIKKVMLDVAKEEKTHAGEFEALLKRLDEEYTEELEEGEKEVIELSADVVSELVKIANALNDKTYVEFANYVSDVISKVAAKGKCPGSKIRSKGKGKGKGFGKGKGPIGIPIEEKLKDKENDE